MKANHNTVGDVGLNFSGVVNISSSKNESKSQQPNISRRMDAGL